MSTTSTGSSDGGLGQRIREFRLKRAMTQGDLAGDEYSVSYISAIERGKVKNPSRAVVQWCAEQLGVAVAELQGESVLNTADGRWIQQQLSRHAYEQVYAQLLITSGEVAEGLQQVRQLRRNASAPVERSLIWFSAYGSCLAGDVAAATRDAEVYEQLVRGQRDARDPRDARGDVALHWLLGRIAVASGDNAEAHIEFARALAAELDGLGDPDAAQSIRRSLASALRALHDTARAHKEEADALGEYERFTNPRDSLRWARARAETAAKAGDYANAYLFIRWAWNSLRESAIHRHAAQLYVRHATYVDEDIPIERRETELRRAAMLAELTGDTETRMLAGAYWAQLLAERGASAIADEMLRLTSAPDPSAGSNAAVSDELRVVVALARGWLALASGEDGTAHGFAEEVDAALRTEPAFARSEAKYVGMALWRLFDRLHDDERAFHVLRWVHSH